MKQYFYNREIHGAYNKVCYQLGMKYQVGKGGVVLTSSGMAAINLALTTILIKTNGNTLIMDNIYQLRFNLYFHFYQR